MTTAVTPLGIDAQNLLFRDARTTNSFTEHDVTEDQVQAIYDLMKWAPTSFNQQPLRILLVRSAQARARLVPLMWDNNQEKTRLAPLVAVLAADTEFIEHMPSQFPVFPQASDVFFGDPVVRAESARFNATLQIAYFIVGIRAVGLAAGPMTGVAFDAVDKEFFPDGRLRSLAVVNIGLPSAGAWYDRLPRLGYDQVVRSV